MQKGDAPAVHGLTLKARCVAAQVAESDRNSFWVGTLSLKGVNEIQLLDYHEDDHEIRCLGIMSHPAGEIWNLSPCPSDSDRFFTVYQQTASEDDAKFKATLWKCEDNSKITETHLLQLTTLRNINGLIRHVLWDPSETTQSESLVTLSDTCITVLKLGESTASTVGTISDIRGKVLSGAWSPHHGNDIITANENSIRGWDTRTCKETFNIPQAHVPFVRDVDFNPNKDYCIVSGGDDNFIKFWDTRKTGRPVKAQKAHNHWVQNVKYNRYHDQFVLSSSSDCTVSLWSIPSTSSMASNSELSSQMREDKLIENYNNTHEDSVYSVAWSSASPWVFASLSYSGMLVINQVPKSYSDLLRF
ncbi:hypothetical protein PROFUN_04062 [Planoprotostelium fungivorum]|uniref:EIPR1-like beta-propeller domain-containing protein n=1 Tax=Planoprotostelium fungivorum TaxID=1890364 RepID=A0A2P6NJE9_9EUKA|nr:hypothetical protein PROFUN_04062 [Planoprotostelium fungivorum]